MILIEVDFGDLDRAERILRMTGIAHREVIATSIDQNLLSWREIETLRLLGRALSDRQIAAALRVSLTTAKAFVQNTRKKIGAANRVQVMLYALRNGYARLDEIDVCYTDASKCPKPETPMP